MDFLDTKKMRRHAVLLYTGYIFIGVAVLISAIVLVYQANGFNVNSKGEIVQNGLVFMSSQPNPATIYLNGKQNDAQTNSRLSLPTGSYAVRLTRDGYRDWNRNVNVQGGDVQNFDYPFLIPRDLQPAREATLGAATGMVTQSRDRRWLVVQQAPNATTFAVYDLNKEEESLDEPITLPAGVATAADGTENWEIVQWANDNDYFVVKHTYGSGFEYLLIRRSQPEDSVNLNRTLNVNAADLTLIDNKYDLYHVLVDGTLNTTRLGEPTLTPVASDVLEYKSYGTKIVVYASPAFGNADKTTVSMIDGDRNYTLRQVAKSDIYSLDIAQYRGDQYVVVAASGELMAYVYKNPVQQLRQSTVTQPAAERALRVSGATNVSFSPNTQFILVQNGQSFGVYDLFLKRPYVYAAQLPLDAPQQKAEWIDGFHLGYISGGKQIMFDYDSRNRQTLSNALPGQYAYFSQDYQYLFSFEQVNATVQLTRTPLRTANDL